MLKNLLSGLLLLVVAVFAFVGYNTYSVRRMNTTDEVYGATGQPSKPSSAAAEDDGASGSAQTSPAQALSTQGSRTADLSSNGATTTPGMRAPTGDSIPPDPPNGEKFGASGSKYQLYRQGDITWRLNTSTGETCVIFATDEEWHKPRIYNSGCRGRE